MKKLGEFVVSTLIAGSLVVAPIYLATLLLFRAMQSLVRFMKPLAKLLPDWLPAAQLLALLLVLVLCFLVGIALRTQLGRAVWARSERSIFQKLPGYGLLRSLSYRLAGRSRQSMGACPG